MSSRVPRLLRQGKDAYPMLQPQQLEEVSMHYPREIAELHDFLAKAGLPLDSAGTLHDVAERLGADRGFRRDLTSHVWVAVHSSNQQISYSDLLGMLAIAAAGSRFAAAADDRDAHGLLRFLLEARSSFDTVSETGNRPAVRWPAESASLASRSPSFAMEEDSDGRRPILWIGAAVACLLLVTICGLWFRHHSAEDHSAPTTAVAEGAVPPAVSAKREDGEVASQPSETAAPIVRRGPRHLTSKPLSVVPVSSALPAAVVKKPSPSTFVLPSIATTSAAESPKSTTTVRKAAPAPIERASRSKSNVVAKVSPPDSAGKFGNVPAASAVHGGFVRSTSLGIMAANVLYSPAPAYPAAATSLHVQGEVKLEAEVDREGNVVSTRIISGPPLLQQAAADAVQRWQYRPYLFEGKAIAMNATVVLDFELPAL